MARNNTLEELIEFVRDEAALSTNSSRGTDHRNYIIRLIRRYYEQLYDEHDWPFLRLKREDAGKDIEAGQRYYDFPAELNLERAHKLWVKWGETWIPMEYGITPDDYSAQDSDDDERTDPPLKWQIYDENQFEIWPLPATDNPGGLRFEGIRKATALNEESDRCDLDGTLIALFVAAEILGKNKATAAAAEAKLSAARDRFNTLKARAPRPRVRMGLGHVADTKYRIIGGRYVKVT